MSKIWETRPDLRKAHSRASDARAPASLQEAPASLHKGTAAYGKLDAVAAELRKHNPNLSPSAARVEAAKQRPDLRDEYYRAAR